MVSAQYLTGMCGRAVRLTVFGLCDRVKNRNEGILSP